MKCLARLAVALLVATPALAASESEYAAAFAAAQKAERQALALRNAWTTTETALEDSKKAADAKNYDRATALARQAEALAKASIGQYRKQRTAWRDSVLR